MKSHYKYAAHAKCMAVINADVHLIFTLAKQTYTHALSPRERAQCIASHPIPSALILIIIISTDESSDRKKEKLEQHSHRRQFSVKLHQYIHVLNES